MKESKVYFTKEITPESLIKIYEALGIKLTGNIGIKVSTGEAGSKGYLKSDLIKPLVDKLNGTIVECNTAYEGQRNSTEKHKKLIEDHGWNKYFEVDILDGEGPDLEIGIPNGKIIDRLCVCIRKSLDSFSGQNK